MGWHSSIKHVDENTHSVFRLEMLIRSALVLAFALPTLTGGKISPIDDVIRGVGSPGAGTVKALRESDNTISLTPTPGKLRVVENSGVCGRSILIVGVSPSSC